MSSITASLTTARVAPATRAASKGKRATKAAAVSEKKAGASQEEANDVFGVARKAATAAFAAVAALRHESSQRPRLHGGGEGGTTHLPGLPSISSRLWAVARHAPLVAGRGA